MLLVSLNFHCGVIYSTSLDAVSYMYACVIKVRYNNIYISGVGLWIFLVQVAKSPLQLINIMFMLNIPDLRLILQFIGEGRHSKSALDY